MAAISGRERFAVPALALRDHRPPGFPFVREAEFQEEEGFYPAPARNRKTLQVAANPAAFSHTSSIPFWYVEQKASEFQAKVLTETGASRAEVASVQKRAPAISPWRMMGNYNTKP